MVVRLLFRGKRVRSSDTPTALAKGTRVIANRDLGECGKNHVCRGTAGTVTAVSRMATYEVAFDGGITLTNLDSDHVSVRP